jgi:glycosyltransferase involved in cell wall biosynthesis
MENKNKKTLSVVMISMNEEKAVAAVIKDIRAVATDAEILLVDSSTDKTAEIAQENGAKVIKQYPPKGYGRAMVLALTSASGDVVITLDCDGTYPCEDIPKLFNLINEGYDIVNTTRVEKRPKAMPYENFLANRLFAFCTWLRHGIKTTDVHSGMRAYTKELIHSIDWNAPGLALPVELFIRSIKHGYKYTEVPIKYFERIGNTTLTRFDSTIWTFKRIFCKKYYL